MNCNVIPSPPPSVQTINEQKKIIEDKKTSINDKTKAMLNIANILSSKKDRDVWNPHEAHTYYLTVLKSRSLIDTSTRIRAFVGYGYLLLFTFKERKESKITNVFEALKSKHMISKAFLKQPFIDLSEDLKRQLIVATFYRLGTFGSNNHQKKASDLYLQIYQNTSSTPKQKYIALQCMIECIKNLNSGLEQQVLSLRISYAKLLETTNCERRKNTIRIEQANLFKKLADLDIIDYREIVETYEKLLQAKEVDKDSIPSIQINLAELYFYNSLDKIDLMRSFQLFNDILSTPNLTNKFLIKAKYHVANFYRKGVSNTPPSYKKALELFQEILQFKFNAFTTHSKYYQALVYAHGSPDVLSDEKTATTIFKELCKSKNTPRWMLFDIYFYLIELKLFSISSIEKHHKTFHFNAYISLIEEIKQAPDASSEIKSRATCLLILMQNLTHENALKINPQVYNELEQIGKCSTDAVTKSYASISAARLLMDDSNFEGRENKALSILNQVILINDLEVEFIMRAKFLKAQILFRKNAIESIPLFQEICESPFSLAPCKREAHQKLFEYYFKYFLDHQLTNEELLNYAKLRSRKIQLNSKDILEPNFGFALKICNQILQNISEKALMERVDKTKKVIACLKEEYERG